MAQYVSQLPLPNARAPVAQKLLGLVSALIERGGTDEASEEALDHLVWESFGLSKEIPR